MGKVVSQKEALAVAQAAREEGRIIVATNGCFDLLHVGHIRNLKKARELGNVLFVGLNSDASVRKNKGPARPIVPAKERAEVIAALESVDYVFIFNGRTAFSWIREMRPHFHVKGGGSDTTMHPDFLAQKEAVESGGGTVVLVPHHEGKSSTALMRKVVEAARPARKAIRAASTRKPRTGAKRRSRGSGR